MSLVLSMTPCRAGCTQYSFSVLSHFCSLLHLKFLTALLSLCNQNPHNFQCLLHKLSILILANIRIRKRKTTWQFSSPPHSVCVYACICIYIYAYIWMDGWIFYSQEHLICSFPLSILLTLYWCMQDSHSDTLQIPSTICRLFEKEHLS